MTPDRITALRALEAAMVEGKASLSEIEDLALSAGLTEPAGFTWLPLAYCGQIAAAFAALRELVPGWRLIILQMEDKWSTDLVRGLLKGPSVYSFAIDPARAMSIAIVRALIWEAENA